MIQISVFAVYSASRAAFVFGRDLCLSVRESPVFDMLLLSFANLTIKAVLIFGAEGAGQTPLFLWLAAFYASKALLIIEKKRRS
jgi:hypothetical protein